MECLKDVRDAVTSMSTLICVVIMIPRYENDGQTINWKQTSPTAEELAAVKEEILG